MALSEPQRVIIAALAESPLRERFYWTGGTLLAERYLHHRRSDDVDLFSDTACSHEEILHDIRAMLLGTAEEQEHTVRAIEEYFTTQSNQYLRSQWGGDHA